MKHIAKLKLLSFYVIMIGLTIVVCFALLEFGLARYYQSTESHIAVTTFDPTLGWRLRPGSYSVKPSYTFRHHQVSINEYGLRNRPVSARAASDTKRIVILGDSFTFASAVPNENTFPVILETILSGGGHYEVINAGVRGYGTMRRNFIFLQMATSVKKVTPLWLNNLRHLSLNILGVTRIHTYLENPGKSHV